MKKFIIIATIIIVSYLTFSGSDKDETNTSNEDYSSSSQSQGTAILPANVGGNLARVTAYSVMCDTMSEQGSIAFGALVMEYGGPDNIERDREFIKERESIVNISSQQDSQTTCLALWFSLKEIGLIEVYFD